MISFALKHTWYYSSIFVCTYHVPAHGSATSSAWRDLRHWELRDVVCY